MLLRQKTPPVRVKDHFPLREYQKKVINDPSRLIAVVKARQIGLTETASIISVTKALSRPRHDVWIVATNLDTAKELVWRAAAWYRAVTVTTKPGMPSIASESTERIIFSNGSRITALPCSERALRGKSGTVIMDEAAHIPNDEAIWKAFAPVISSNDSLALYMISTPFGQSGIFYRACHGLLDGTGEGELKWSVHRIDVHEAIAQGHSPTVLSLKSSYTEEAWAQEFLCSFNSQQGKYFSAELIRSCTGEALDNVQVIHSTLGIDLASKKDSSIAVPAYWGDDGRVYFAEPFILSTSSNPVQYPQQLEKIREIINQHQFEKVIVDATGPGDGLAQFLKQEFGARVIAHHSTATWKEKYYPALLFDMQNSDVTICHSNILLTAFNSVIEKKTVSNSRVYTLQRDENGHADAFAAAILAYSVFKKFPDQKPSASLVTKMRGAMNRRSYR